MKLCLGVVDINYADHTESETTGEVAQILEDKYHVMEIFYDLHSQEIANAIGSGIAGALENARAGKKTSGDVYLGAMGKTEKIFRKYIDTSEHGIKLKKLDAPQAGARHKRQYKKVKVSVAFIDSGLYRRMFKAWVDT